MKLPNLLMSDEVVVGFFNRPTGPHPDNDVYVFAMTNKGRTFKALFTSRMYQMQPWELN